MSLDERWMREALKEAQVALVEDEVPVGAVVVKENELVSKAHNLSRQNNDPSEHA